MSGIMLDLETFGTTPGCAIFSIGAVRFDAEGIHQRVHIHIDPDQKLHIEPRTVMWWLEQSKEAQEALLRQTRVSLADALTQLDEAFDWEDSQVWANGASFDFPILKAAYDVCSMQAPWRYYNEMCYRTIRNTVPKATFNQSRVTPRIPHDALCDAEAQALTLINLLYPKEVEHAQLRA